MSDPFISISADPDAEDGVSVSYHRDFLKKPLAEQAALMTAALRTIADECVGVHEEFHDSINSAPQAATVGAAA